MRLNNKKKKKTGKKLELPNGWKSLVHFDHEKETVIRSRSIREQEFTGGCPCKQQKNVRGGYFGVVQYGEKS